MTRDKKCMRVRLPFPQNPSSQELMNSNNRCEFEYREEKLKSSSSSRCSAHHIMGSQWRSVAILFFVNLINYMDRFTVAGILGQIKEEYGIGDSKSGALQTAFVISYMIFAPLFGYFGDRHSRRLIMSIGVFIWAMFTLIGSFMPDYYSFLVCRAMVGIGEASYSTIAPTIISDMFVKENRSRMLALFFFAIPLGCGSGYMLGAEMANLTGDWRWGLRITPILGFAAVIMILFLLQDPNRGESEGHGNDLETTTYFEDLRGLANNRSFVLSTLGFTCVTFCSGALSWWGPHFIMSGIKTADNEKNYSMALNNVSLVFGAVTMLSGIFGVPLGSLLSTKLKPKYPRADPVICGIGLIISAIFLGIGMATVKYNIYLTFVLLFFGEVALNINWSIVADILLYVVIPTRRSTAEAVQILISHALGDAGSPYFIGLISDYLKVHYNTTESLSRVDLNTSSTYRREIDYYSLQHSLFSNCGVQIIGGFLFFVTAVFLVKDKLRCQRIIGGRDHSWLDEEDSAPQKKPFIQDKESSVI